MKNAIITGICTILAAIIGVFGGAKYERHTISETIYEDNRSLHKTIELITAEKNALTQEFAAERQKTTAISNKYDSLKKEYENILQRYKDIMKRTLNSENKSSVPDISIAPSIPGETQDFSLLKTAYLTDMLTAYQHHSSYDRGDYQEFSEKNGTSGEGFSMAGKRYFNGFVFQRPDDMGGRKPHFALFNLNSDYSTLEVLIGPLDKTWKNNVSINIYGDRKIIKQIKTSFESYPQKILLNVKNINQLKFEINDFPKGGGYGFANPTLR